MQITGFKHIFTLSRRVVIADEYADFRRNPAREIILKRNDSGISKRRKTSYGEASENKLCWVLMPILLKNIVGGLARRSDRRKSNLMNVTAFDCDGLICRRFLRLPLTQKIALTGQEFFGYFLAIQKVTQELKKMRYFKRCPA